MPTLLEISNELARSYAHADNKKHAVTRILTEINSLVYSSSKQPVEHSVKIMIVRVVYEFISGQRAFLYKNGKNFSLTDQHISLFVKMSNKLLK
jgi:hypothetical protein